VFLAERRVFLPGLLDGVAELEEESLAHHLEDVEARAAVGVLQVGIGLAPKLDDVVLLVHDHARRGVPGEEDPICFPGALLAWPRRGGQRPGLLPLSTVRNGADQTQSDGSGSRSLGIDAVLPVHGGEELR
jgi:hypothetical protein